MSAALETGLLGSGIGRSMAPMLHELLGTLSGRDVRYIRHDRPMDFTEVAQFLDDAHDRGVVGLNVTYPFKEAVVPFVRIDDANVRAIGAVNTVCFSGGERLGFNTDYSGLRKAYRERFGSVMPGAVAQFGGGGMGKAAIFAMASLGATEIILFDPDHQRAEHLARSVQDLTGVVVRTAASAEAAASDAEGVLNCSPVGMYTSPGCPVEAGALKEARWVFDAVYAPMRTEFIAHAERAGAEVLSGSELFFWQGIDAFELFHQTTVSHDVLAAAREVVGAEVARRSAENR